MQFSSPMRIVVGILVGTVVLGVCTVLHVQHRQALDDSLARAVIARDLGGVKRALAAGASVNATCWDNMNASRLERWWRATVSLEGKTQIAKALGNGDAGIARELLAHGASLDGPSNGSAPPVAEAVSSGSIECLQLVLDRGAAVNVSYWRDSVRETPLSCAVRLQKMPVVKYLLQRGATVELEKDGGVQALSATSGNKTPDILALLIDHGADPFRANDSGWRAVDFAADTSNAALRVWMKRWLTQHAALAHQNAAPVAFTAGQCECSK